MTALKEMVPPGLVRDLLMARGARNVRFYDIGPCHIIYTEEPFVDGDYARHMSVSCEGRHPTWEEQRDAVWAVMGENDHFVQVVPPRKSFGTLDGSHVFHWFELPMGVSTDFVQKLGDWL